MGISIQTRWVAALVTAAVTAAVALGVGAGSAPAVGGKQAGTALAGASAGNRVVTTAAPSRFCRRHPRRPRCRRLRVKLSWDDNANIDLYVWDTSLRMASPFRRFAIPRAFHSGDTGVLPEKFFDRRRTPLRKFAVGVCLLQEPFADPTVYTLTVKLSNGQTFTVVDELFDRGDHHHYYEPGAPNPDPTGSGNWCRT